MFNPFTAKNLKLFMLFHFKNILGEKVKLIESTGFENLFCATMNIGLWSIKNLYTKLVCSQQQIHTKLACVQCTHHSVMHVSA